MIEANLVQYNRPKRQISCPKSEVRWNTFLILAEAMKLLGVT